MKGSPDTHGRVSDDLNGPMDGTTARIGKARLRKHRRKPCGVLPTDGNAGFASCRFFPLWLHGTMSGLSFQLLMRLVLPPTMMSTQTSNPFALLRFVDEAS